MIIIAKHHVNSNSSITVDHVNKKIHLTEWLTPLCEFELGNLSTFDEESRQRNKYQTYLSWIYKYKTYELCEHCLTPDRVFDDDGHIGEFLKIKH